MRRSLLIPVLLAFCLATTMSGPISSLLAPNHNATVAWADGSFGEPPYEPEPPDSTGVLGATTDSTGSLTDDQNTPDDDSSLTDMLWLILQGL